MRTLVALDLETTGLDPARDAVIEIGAVRFRGDRVEAEWSTLVNPGRPLPPFITQLTGISDPMLAQAPRLAAVLGALSDFVGDAPLVGHSVGFDLAFLRRKGVLADNATLDTFDLASVLLPSAARYRLAALAAEFGIPVPQAHRGLADARTTHLVFQRLRQRARELPLPLLDELVRLGAEIEWGAGWVLEEALELAQRERPPDAGPLADVAPVFPAPDRSLRPLTPASEKTPLEVEALAALLEPRGALSQAFEGYEHRPQQLTMLRAVSRAFSEGRHLLVEAGTGTGKSLAYLAPAFAWAEQNGERVVVSTNTINLQEQLIHKDLPQLAQAFGRELRAAVLKGRTNYLCPRRLNALRRLGPRTPEELRVLAKVLVRTHDGGTGDRSEITLTGPAEAAAWSRLSADSPDCGGEACEALADGGCPYLTARHAAEAAHVLIVNHALLLADVATGSRVLPPYRLLVVDEAHNLEEAVTSALAFRVGEAELARLLHDLSNPREGLLAHAAGVAAAGLPATLAAQVQRAGPAIAGLARESAALSQAFFGAVAELMASQREGREPGPYGQQMRILPSTRTLPGWSTVEAAWEDLRTPLAAVLSRLESLADGVGGVGEADDAGDDLAVALRAAGRDLSGVFGSLERMVFDPDPQTVYWAEVRPAQGRVALHAAPLEVGHLIERHLWREKDSIVMTSATLTAAGEFDYLRRRLGAEDAEELALGSPFDYESSTLLYLVDDVPEPAERQAYEQAVERGLLRLCRATRGRALVLFTSYEHLRRVARALSEPLMAQGIYVLEQGEGASRHRLLDDFRAAEQAVLLGTRSFWEGVDVPGQALSVLAIVRLPFDVPSDPIVAARAEACEHPFNDYAIPEAILRFRQGFGRLIRTRSDRGVVAVFDRRLISKPYGRIFLDSLPTCTVRRGPLTELPAAAARWLGL